jgi:hypothetical protein
MTDGSGFMVRLRARRLRDADREFGAEDLAVVARGAALLRDDLGRMVALEVETVRHREDVARAELDAVRAPLAALLENVDRTPDPRNAIRVQRDPPEPFRRGWSHETSSFTTGFRPRRLDRIVS